MRAFTKFRITIPTFFTILVGLLSLSVQAQSDLESKQWFAGVSDCNISDAPPIEIYEHTASTWILRQNKCDTWEAPFMYLLIGTQTALLFDTGDFANKVDSPLEPIVSELLTAYGHGDKTLIVMHSHAHSDHTKGDEQFLSRASTVVVDPSISALEDYLAISSLEKTGYKLELGDRTLTILPTPGHHSESITVYDHQDKLLLTGDTFYPGMIIVKNWKAFTSSIQLLSQFAAKHEVKYILGGHIEMSSTPRQLYNIGSHYHPNEHGLALSVKQLNALNSQLQQTPKKTKLVFDDFVIAPMTGLQKVVSAIGTFLFGS